MYVKIDWKENINNFTLKTFVYLNMCIVLFHLCNKTNRICFSCINIQWTSGLFLKLWLVAVILMPLLGHNAFMFYMYFYNQI